MFPAISTSEPNSPTRARERERAAGEDGRARGSGSTIRRNIVEPLAPSDAAASSMSRSSSSSTGCTERTTNGSVTNSSATTMPSAGVGDVDAERAAAGRRARAASGRRRSWAARRAGRSARSTVRLPRKRSRTSTHAMSVPMTALTATTTSEATRSAERRQRLGVGDRGPEAVEPPSGAVRRRAPRAGAGRSAEVDDRDAEAERPTPRRARPTGRRGARRRRRDGRSRCSAVDALALDDLRDDAVVRVEELRR